MIPFATRYDYPREVGKGPRIQHGFQKTGVQVCESCQWGNGVQVNLRLLALARCLWPCSDVCIHSWSHVAEALRCHNPRM